MHITGKDGLVTDFPDTRTINGTKQNVCLTADLFGAWREEFVVPSSDGKALYVCTTTIPTSERLYTLMHDRAYRMQTVSQTVGYNQPPHIGYYLGEKEDERDSREEACRVRTVHDGVAYERNQ